MVIDTSAILAILQAEPTAAALAGAIEADATRLLSAAILLEACLVVEARYGAAGARQLDLFILKAKLEIAPVTAEQAAIARNAWRRYGKGRHPASLNYGDCFSYALAKAAGESLLCVGQDFAHTDLPLVSI